jgi:hypothetical protein
MKNGKNELISFNDLGHSFVQMNARDYTTAGVKNLRLYILNMNLWEKQEKKFEPKICGLKFWKHKLKLEAHTCSTKTHVRLKIINVNL